VRAAGVVAGTIVAVAVVVVAGTVLAAGRWRGLRCWSRRARWRSPRARQGGRSMRNRHGQGHRRCWEETSERSGHTVSRVLRVVPQSRRALSDFCAKRWATWPATPMPPPERSVRMNRSRAAVIVGRRSFLIVISCCGR
jgi:hypothetical protein